ncbi:type II secretion system F family protein [Arthrobacter jiangjiafuii]|uniref:Type II secretion system F family protein n=1 Tax=Arthrobacter jiangjiafuii TaxID=2817475 RepID=A0A975M4A9_9MICC|nr:type II secretion system F family protein [Arthrobacter jiangjiafuii]MBP3042545.1 type II secretion system F family protein [Arthrobacter jiangjiafuii]QWC09718.1 type II secretion system F family protein [Arthrobacter jiangjiafuii]
MAGAVIFGLFAAAAMLLLQPGRRSLSVLEPESGSAADPDAGPGPGSNRSGAIGRTDGVDDPALMLDLVAAMLDAGQPLLSALSVLADIAEPGTAGSLRRVRAALELGAPWVAAWELAVPHPGNPAARSLLRSPAAGPDPAACLRDALTFVATTGAPSAAVLMAEAAQLRRRRSREAERRAAALGVRLVVPLGLCALPAFIVLTVVPLLLSLLPAFP